MTDDRVLDRLIADFDIATLLYSEGTIGIREYLQRTRPTFLAVVDELLLYTVRATITVTDARGLGLIPTTEAPAGPPDERRAA